MSALKVLEKLQQGTLSHQVLLRVLRLGVIMGNLLSSREVQQGTLVIKEQNMVHLISFGKDTLTLNQTRDHIYLLLLRVDLQTLFMKIIVHYFQLLVIEIHGQFLALAYRLTFAQDENLHQEKVQQEMLKAVKARLNFEETLQYPESETPNRRRNLKERSGPRGARTRSVSPKQRRGRSKSPKEKGPERRTVFKILEKGVFHRLGDKEKNVSAHSRGSERKSYYSSRKETESCYQSSLSEETEIASEKHRHKREYTRKMEAESESKGNPFTPRIRYFDFPKTRMPSHIKTYDESEDPEDHLKIFQAAAKTKRWAMPTWCHMFNSTLTENARQEKLNAVKARFNFEETLQYSESETSNRRRNLKDRLGPRGARTRSVSPEQRRDLSKSPKEKGPERRTMFKILEKGVFHRLGDKEKNVSAHSRGSERKEYSRRMEAESECEESAGGHWKSKLKKRKSSMEDDLSQPWVYEETYPFTPKIPAKTKRWAMPTWCHMFNSTLIENARVWFDDLPKESIDSYDDLRKAFLENYLQQKKSIKDPVEIHNFKQRNREFMEEFVRRYKLECRDVKGASECMKISGFVHVIINPELIKRLHDKIPKPMDEMMSANRRNAKGWKTLTSDQGVKAKQQERSGKDSKEGETSGKDKPLAILMWRNNMASRVDIVASKDRRRGTLNVRSDEFHGGEITLSLQQDYTKTGSKEDSSKSIHSTRNDKIPSDQWDSHIAKKQDHSARMLNGFRTEKEGRKELCGLLRRHLDVFAWKPADMTGVPRHIADYRLNVREGCLPVRQKKRGKAPERNKAISKEVKKLMEVGIMKEFHYHSWLSNPVMVKKHDDSWRMCVDFKDFNKACPKDGYKVDADGLRVSPDKVKAVIDLPSPKCLKDVQILNEKLASLNRFLSKSAKKSLLFFKTLKKCTKKSDFQWTLEEKEAFKEIKQSIAELSMLTAPKEKEELIIYLTAVKEAVSAVLMTERDEKQIPIYFVSRALQGP
nr:reverse transcriptase domain-containing protein [Tanacetum cinerariifolium]